MLPLGEMLGPFGPCVASRHGAPSSQADLMSALSFSLIGMSSCFRCGDGLSDGIVADCQRPLIGGPVRHRLGEGGRGVHPKPADTICLSAVRRTLRSMWVPVPMRRGAPAI